MSLVVAKKINNIIIIVSDTRLTYINSGKIQNYLLRHECYRKPSL